MSLQFVFGNSGSGKSYYLYHYIVEEAVRHPETNYLVLGDFGEVGAKKVEKALEQREKGKDIKIIIESDLFRFM